MLPRIFKQCRNLLTGLDVELKLIWFASDTLETLVWELSLAQISKIFEQTMLVAKLGNVWKE